MKNTTVLANEFLETLEIEVDKFIYDVLEVSKTEGQEMIEDRYKKLLKDKDCKIKFLNEQINELKKQYSILLEGTTKEVEEAKTQRADEVLKELDRLQPMYCVKYTYVVKPKCNQCNEFRKITFLSPLGTEMQEPCTCSYRYPKAYVSSNCALIQIGETIEVFEWDGIDKDYLNHMNDCDAYQIYTGEKFEELEEPSVNFQGEPTLLFKSKDDCQKYCDYLNQKNGITSDMSAWK